MDSPMRQALNLHIKSLQGNEYMVEIEDDKLVSDLKDAISTQPNGIPAVRQRLVYKGRPMTNTDKLSEYGLISGCKIHLIITPNKSSSEPASNQQQERISQNQPTITPLNLAPEQLKLDALLRQKLASHLNQETIDKVINQMHKDLQQDLKMASLDDLERLAQQKLEPSEPL